MELIPGLSNDVASQCMMRLPYDEFDKASGVSKDWLSEIKQPWFHPMRRSIRATQPAIVVVQAVVDPIEKQFHGKNWKPNLTNHLAILNLKTGCWSKLPDLPEGIPSYCKLAGVGTELVLIGGLDYDKCHGYPDSVFIFNFISCKWRSGARMPGPCRRDYGCVSDLDRTIYVAGGSDDKTLKPFKDLMAYDVVEDKWMVLPEMARARVSCQILFYEGRLHVTKDRWIGTGCTRDVEVFDVEKTIWVDSVFYEDNMDLGSYVNDGDGGIYRCGDENLMLREGVDWKKLVDFPKKIRVFFATIWERKLILVGTIEYEELIKTFAMDLDNYSWKTLDTLHDCTWLVESGCYLEI